MSTKGLVSIVLPTYNEEAAIGQVINDVKKTMSQTSYDYEIIVIDDASTDKTVEVAEFHEVKVIKRSINRGSGASRKTGIRSANGEIIVMLDADCSYEASDIPKLLEHFPEYDQVNGARTSEEGSLKILRAPAKWLIKKLACYLTDTKIPDLNTGFKAFKKDIMMRYLWVIPDGFSCVTTMTLAFISEGYNVKYVPTKYHKRVGKSKFHPVLDTYSYILTIVRMVMYFNPLKIFLPVSLFMFVAASLKTIHDLFINVIPDTTFMNVVLLISSVIIAVLGLLADLIVAQGRAKSSVENTL